VGYTIRFQKIAELVTDTVIFQACNESLLVIVEFLNMRRSIGSHFTDKIGTLNQLTLACKEFDKI